MKWHDYPIIVPLNPHEILIIGGPDVSVDDIVDLHKDVFVFNPTENTCIKKG